ncbi:MAG: hypothetical protein ACLFV5_07320 [Anaerolineales bacterium]
MRDLQALLERHEAFWHREEVDRPLVRLLPRERDPVRFDNMDVRPDMLDVERLTPSIGERNIWKRLVQEDLLRTEPAFTRIPWMEAIVGCDIHAGTENAMWPEPALGPDYEGMDEIVPADDNPWLEKLFSLTEALVEINDGSYVVTHTLMRGPADMLSALLGDDRMGLAFYDDPDRVDTCLARAAEAFIKVAKAQFDVIPLFHGGRTAWVYGLWGRGSVVRFQSDSSSQLSPTMYAERILPHDRKIMEAFDKSLIDLHSAGTLHIREKLMGTEELDAISVTLDRYEDAPTVEDLLPIFAEILEAKSLLIFGEMTAAEADLLCSKLPARGLAIGGHITDKLLWERPV